MSKTTFQYGDTVRHPGKPEWGIGTVTSVKTVTVDGARARSVSARFPNAGLKTINTAYAALEHADTHQEKSETVEQEGLDPWKQDHESGWLSSVAEQKIEEQMYRLPEAASDPFQSLPNRIQFTLDLYRFDDSAKGLIDWAVAQSGLGDPLSRFSRHKLEQMFERWSYERDNHLRTLVRQAKSEGVSTKQLLADAPAAAQRAMRRVGARR